MVKICFLLILVGLINGCAPIYNPWAGNYGPFELTLEAENGEHVEDMIVTLVHITANSFEGMTATYNETQIAETGKPILFPRGHVYETDKDTLEIMISISHPYYKINSTYLSFPNKSDGKINLGVRTIVSIKSVRMDFLKKIQRQWEQKGLSKDEIQRRLAKEKSTKRGILNWVARNYFPEAVEIGRKDLVDKYLPLMIQEIIEEEKVDIDSAMLDQHYRKVIEKYTR